MKILVIAVISLLFSNITVSALKAPEGDTPEIGVDAVTRLVEAFDPSYPEPEREVDISLSQDQEYQATYRVAPIYPRKAQEKGLCGQVLVRFSISKDGSTQNIRIEESSDEIFERAAARAVSKFKYTPRIIGGQAVDVDDVLHMLTFFLESLESEGEINCYGDTAVLAERYNELRKEREREEEEEKERERERERERKEIERKKKEIEQRRERKLRFMLGQEALHSDYEYGDKQEPIVKKFINNYDSQNLTLSRERMVLVLDFGKGVAVKALRGYLTCDDIFDEQVFEGVFVVDKKVDAIKNKIVEGYKDWSYKKSRPLESVHNIASFNIENYDAEKILRAGGIKKCDFRLRDVVFEDK